MVVIVNLVQCVTSECIHLSLCKQHPWMDRPHVSRHPSIYAHCCPHTCAWGRKVYRHGSMYALRRFSSDSLNHIICVCVSIVPHIQTHVYIALLHMADTILAIADASLAPAFATCKAV